MTATAADTFRHVLNLLKEKRMEEFVNMYAEDAVMEYPFAHVDEGWPKRLEGREAIRGHVIDYPDFLDLREFRNLNVWQTEDPEMVVAEGAMAGIVTPTGQPYEVQYADFVRIRNGKIVHWRDYWDPTVAASMAPAGLG